PDAAPARLTALPARNRGQTPNGGRDEVVTLLGRGQTSNGGRDEVVTLLERGQTPASAAAMNSFAIGIHRSGRSAKHRCDASGMISSRLPGMPAATSRVCTGRHSSN